MNSASVADRAIGWVDVDDLSEGQIDRSVKVGGRQICLQTNGRGPKARFGFVDDDTCVNRENEAKSNYKLLFATVDAEVKWREFEGSKGLGIGDNNLGARICRGTDSDSDSKPWKDLGYIEEGNCKTFRSGGLKSQESYKELNYRFRASLGDDTIETIRTSVKKYAPTLIFHEDEAFHPMDPADFVENVNEGNDDGLSLKFSVDTWDGATPFGIKKDNIRSCLVKV